MNMDTHIGVYSYFKHGVTIASVSERVSLTNASSKKCAAQLLMTTHPPTSKSLRIQGTHTVPSWWVLAAFKHHANKSEPGHTVGGTGRITRKPSEKTA